MLSTSSVHSVPRLTARLHPDALYDQPYQEVEIDTCAYQPLIGRPRLLAAEPAGALWRCDNGYLRIDHLVEGMIRVRLASAAEPTSSLTERLGLACMTPQPGRHRQVTTESTLRFITEELELDIDLAAGDWRLAGADGCLLWRSADGGPRLGDPTPDGAGQRFACTSLLRNERFFGFGARTAAPDRTGATVDIFSVKAGLVSGDYGGFPLPYFFSTAGFGFFLNNPWPHVYFDMGASDPTRWSVHAPGGDCDLIFIAGPTCADVVRRFTAIVGRIPLIPRWMLGYWCSSLKFNAGAQAVADARRMRAEGCPCDVFVFDGPWRGGQAFAALYGGSQQYPSNDMQWHPDFGDGPATIAQLHELGIKTSLHLNSRNFAPDTAAAGVARGLLRQQGDEVVPRVGDPAGEAYYESHLVPRIAEGVDLWWTDHSDRVSGELAPGVPSRNLFGALWNRLLAQIMARQGRPQDLSLSRGGGIGSQRYAIPWPGDTRCGVDALADDLAFMLSGGISGFPLTSIDLAGFAPRGNPRTDYPDQQAVEAEMFDDENICRRLCQPLLFTPVPRMHGNWATPPKWPWHCSAPARRLYREALRFRYRLTPYLYACAIAAARTGAPILRPMVYHHPDDPDAIAATMQFYLGPALLVAPVTQAGRDTWSVYLPQGRWTNWWTDRVYTGPARIEVAAPLRELAGLPLFARAGAIVPRQPVTDHLEEQAPEQLDFDVFPDDQAAFDLHETAAVTHRLEVRRAGANWVISLPNLTAAPRRYRVALHLGPGQVIQSPQWTVEPGATAQWSATSS